MPSIDRQCACIQHLHHQRPYTLDIWRRVNQTLRPGRTGCHIESILYPLRFASALYQRQQWKTDNSGRWPAMFPKAFGIVVAPQRVDNRGAQNHSCYGAVHIWMVCHDGQCQVSRIVRPHSEQHSQVRPAGRAHGADFVGNSVPRFSLGFAPANSIVDICQGGRVRRHRRRSKIQRCYDHSLSSESLVTHIAGMTISPDPGPAMQLNDDRKWAATARFEQTRRQGDISVAKLFYVFDIQVVSLHSG